MCAAPANAAFQGRDASASEADFVEVIEYSGKSLVDLVLTCSELVVW